MSGSKKRVLVCVDWFEPGFKAGGPIRSAVNFVSNLKNDLDIYVFTSDRDLGDLTAYAGIQTDIWISNSGYHIYYASPRSLSWNSISILIKSIKPDYLYLNSMFSKYFSLFPLLMHKYTGIRAKVVLAPRGMLKGSALVHKSFKKTVFLKLIDFAGIANAITFHATDAQEEQDIKRFFGENTRVTRQANLPGRQMPIKLAFGKKKDSLEMVFIGRIHPIKNLDFLLSVLADCKKKIKLTLIGPAEDEGYWQHCNQMIKSLPSNIQVVHLHDVPHNEITDLILNNHIFTLPTKGENFGHAIFESLAAGRPVLISDQTPWRNLENERAGWDVPLSEKTKFSQIVDLVAEMDETTLNEWCVGAWEFCKSYLNKSDLKQGYKRLFT